MSLRSIKGASFGQIVFRMSLLCAEKSDNAVWGSGFLSRTFRPPKLLSPPIIWKLVCRTLDAVDCIELVGSERREYEQQTERLQHHQLLQQDCGQANTNFSSAGHLWYLQDAYMILLSHWNIPFIVFFLLPVNKFSTERRVSGKAWLIFETTVAEGKVRLGFSAS